MWHSEASVTERSKLQTHRETSLTLFYEFAHTGSEVSGQLMEVLVAVLEAIMSLFSLVVAAEQGALTQCASLLLK